jgi:hypothetical protein
MRGGNRTVRNCSASQRVESSNLEALTFVFVCCSANLLFVMCWVVRCMAYRERCSRLAAMYTIVAFAEHRVAMASQTSRSPLITPC